MKAIVYERYGEPSVLQRVELPLPEPKEDEVRIAVHATTVTAADWRARSLQMPRGFGMMGRLIFGLSRPRQPVLGSELAGRVDAVGAKVTRFKVGDDVFAFAGIHMGCYAEYRCLKEQAAIVKMPPGLGYEQAAALSFGGTTALHYLRKAGVRQGETMLVNGASGAVGTAFVQIAKHLGVKVTAVCSGANAALVSSLGAERVIDYGAADFAAEAVRYDVIVDTVGNAPYARVKPVLAPNGRVLAVAAPLAEMLRAPLVGLFSGHRVIVGPASERREDLEELAQLAAAGAYRPVVDRTYPLDDIVAAHTHVDTGRKRGNLVIKVA